MSDGFLDLRDWLVANGITRVGMDAMASDWKPLFYLLEATEGTILAPQCPSHQDRARPQDGREGLPVVCQLSPTAWSVPGFGRRQLLDLTRYRTETVRGRVRDVNRLSMFLEDAGIKLSAVVSDVTGKSARRMLDALIDGDATRRSSPAWRRASCRAKCRC